MKEYFGYESPSFLIKDLCESNQYDKNDMIVKYLNESFIDLRNNINIQEISKNENPKIVVDIVEKSSTLINNKKVKDFHVW